MSVQPVEPDDDLLTRATRAVRELDVPSGPAPLLVERTRRALADARFGRAGGGGGTGRAAFRWAAVALLAGAGVTAAWQFLGRGKAAPLAQSPPAPAPADRPAAPKPVLAGLVRVDGPVPVLPASLLPPVTPGPGCGQHPPVRDQSLVIAAAGGVANVVVAVTAGLPADGEYAAPAAPAVIDQKDCVYHPRVVGMQVGQELVARNSDPFLHTVRTNPLANRPVNIGQPSVDTKGAKLKAIKAPETFKVTCDLHPWMVAWVAAFDHPYFAVTGPDGRFEMPALPPGTYTVRAWHERLGAADEKVAVAADGKLPALQFRFTAEQVAAAVADLTPTTSAAAGGACCAGSAVAAAAR